MQSPREMRSFDRYIKLHYAWPNVHFDIIAGQVFRKRAAFRICFKTSAKHVDFAFSNTIQWRRRTFLKNFARRLAAHAPTSLPSAADSSDTASTSAFQRNLHLVRNSEVYRLTTVSLPATMAAQFHSVTPLIHPGSSATLSKQDAEGASGESQRWVPKGQGDDVDAETLRPKDRAKLSA